MVVYILQPQMTVKEMFHSNLRHGMPVHLMYLPLIELLYTHQIAHFPCQLIIWLEGHIKQRIVPSRLNYQRLK